MTGTIHHFGHDSSRQFHAGSTKALRTPPRPEGADVEIKFAVGESSLGQVLVAARGEGVCFLAIGDEAEPLLSDLQSRFPKARLAPGGADLQPIVAEVVRFVDAPATGLELPLDIHGTAFQQRVWAALRAIPAGSRVSYAEIAARIGEPKAMRAVAGACAANKIAVAIPCHRVVRSDGSLSGYRWGVERKRALLESEAKG